jgi:poly(3-hydroxybutyrate) depolymerase
LREKNIRLLHLYVPKSYDRSKATPLVICIHPAAAWPALQMTITWWNEVADTHGLRAFFFIRLRAEATHNPARALGGMDRRAHYL